MPISETIWQEFFFSERKNSLPESMIFIGKIFPGYLHAEMGEKNFLV